MFKKLRKLAKEEPIWLSICLVAISLALSTMSIMILIARFRWGLWQ